MPGAPAVSTTQVARTSDPVDIFTLRYHGQPSILDTIFVSTKSTRAVYATTTQGTRTSLWRVAVGGTMTEIARVDWEYEIQSVIAGDGSLRNGSKPSKKCSMLTFGGKMIRTDEFLQKGKGWFSSDSRSFSFDGLEFKWKSGTETTGGENHTQNSTSAYQASWRIWRCVTFRDTPNPSASRATSFPALRNLFPQTTTSTEDTTTPGPVRPSESHRDHEGESSTHSAILNAPALPNVLARFAPPQLGLEHNAISLFPPADPHGNQHLVENLLVSAILLAIRKEEWKHIQSTIGASALQAVFLAEAAGEVPPYTPGGQRTQTGNTTRIRQRTQSERSRGAATFGNQRVEESDRTPLLPQRNTHRSSRSTPFSVFPTLPFNIGTISGRSGRALFNDRTPTSVTRRPATADAAPAGDGVFSRRRPSMQAALTRARTASQNRGTSTAVDRDALGIPSTGSPPPAYK